VSAVSIATTTDDDDSLLASIDTKFQVMHDVLVFFFVILICFLFGAYTVRAASLN
jgi:hypothetical protein